MSPPGDDSPPPDSSGDRTDQTGPERRRDEDRAASPDGEGSGASGAGAHPVDLHPIRGLIDQVEEDIPEPYRAAVLDFLLPRVWTGAEAGPRRPPGPGTAGERRDEAPRELEARPVDLAPFAELLAQPGKNLLKALVALEVAGTQLDVEWMTPSEIERFLSERARVRSVYRTNLSNALRSARQGVDRRRRGRGYEYRITDQGRELLRRELEILGP